MGRRHDRRGRGESSGFAGDAEFERTLAAAEEEAAQEGPTGPQSSAAVTRCACGSSEFLLEAYLHVVDGVPRPEPVEVESLTCPECGREYEAIMGESGRILRGDFIGYVEEESD
jgi:hypothetical protein